MAQTLDGFHATNISVKFGVNQFVAFAIPDSGMADVAIPQFNVEAINKQISMEPQKSFFAKETLGEAPSLSYVNWSKSGVLFGVLCKLVSEECVHMESDMDVLCLFLCTPLGTVGRTVPCGDHMRVIDGRHHRTCASWPGASTFRACGSRIFGGHFKATCSNLRIMLYRMSLTWNLFWDHKKPSFGIEWGP